MILDFMAKNSERQTNNTKEYLDEDIDFVQIKTTSVFTKLMCLILEKGQSYTAERVSVGAVIDSKKKEFTSVVCNACEGKMVVPVECQQQKLSFLCLLFLQQTIVMNFSFHLQAAYVTTESHSYFGCIDDPMNQIPIVQHFGDTIHRAN